MSGSSFRIDLDEVEAAAKAIRAMLDDLEAPTARLESVIKQIKATAYGSEAVGKSLTGGTSSVGGLPEHQEQVFAGVKAYLQNSAQMAANLELMVQRYRETEASQTAELSRLNGGRGGEPGALATPVEATARLTAVEGVRASQVSEPLRAVDGIPATQASEPLRAVDGIPATQVSEPLRAVDGIPANQVPLPTAHPTETAYHDPDAPDLSYNHRDTDREVERPVHGGGHQLI
ncbi:hypothetical protein BX265_5058 [Streptomyces sp. TLI_235]|nr:hypothetical protein [Streptomyces sp. TLI_235]PBC70518.1 hypothetical protein BX265_5058 [Streptomyces sp. TLI_235]